MRCAGSKTAAPRRPSPSAARECRDFSAPVLPPAPSVRGVSHGGRPVSLSTAPARACLALGGLWRGRGGRQRPLAAVAARHPGLAACMQRRRATAAPSDRPYNPVGAGRGRAPLSVTTTLLRTPTFVVHDRTRAFQHRCAVFSPTLRRVRPPCAPVPASTHPFAMDTHSTGSDVEATGAKAPAGMAAPVGLSAAEVNHRRKRQEAAAMLLLWSALVLTEGTVRFVLSGPAKDLTPANRASSDPPPLLGFLGALFECVFGITGILVGAGALLFNAHNRMVTIAFLATQTVMSWFTFIVYVFLLPAYRSAFLTGPLLPFDSISESRAFITMGILTSVSLCLALQGGQFAMGLSLLAYQAPQGKASETDANKAAIRGVFWNGNMVLGGLSTTVAGALLLVAEKGGAGRLDATFVAPPHVGVFPLMTLCVGIVMTFCGGLGMLASLRSNLVKTHIIYSAVTWVYMYLNFTIVQLGATRPAAPAQAAAFHSGLVLLTALIGPYFSNQAKQVRAARVAAQ